MRNDPEILAVDLPRKPPFLLSLWKGRIETETRWLMPEIVAVVAAAYGVSAADLTGRRKLRCLAIPRAHAMWLMTQQSHLSLGDIGRFFGHCDHSTAASGRDAHQARIDGLMLSEAA